jgi:hypothetical protein
MLSFVGFRSGLTEVPALLNRLSDQRIITIPRMASTAPEQLRGDLIMVMPSMLIEITIAARNRTTKYNIGGSRRRVKFTSP